MDHQRKGSTGVTWMHTALVEDRLSRKHSRQMSVCLWMLVKLYWALVMWTLHEGVLLLLLWYQYTIHAYVCFPNHFCLRSWIGVAEPWSVWLKLPRYCRRKGLPQSLLFTNSVHFDFSHVWFSLNSKIEKKTAIKTLKALCIAWPTCQTFFGSTLWIAQVKGTHYSHLDEELWYSWFSLYRDQYMKEPTKQPLY